MDRRRWVSGAEVALGSIVVLLDVLLPTLVLLLMASVSLAVRRVGPATLGLVRSARPARMAVEVLGWTVAWTLLEMALVIPVAEHLTGRRQDVSEFAELQGNLGLTLALIGLSWTLAAVGEEVAYRGYLLTRMREALPAGNLGVVTAVLASAVLFGMAHTEQGVVGVLVTTADAVVFTALRYRYRTLWASVLAHGYNNTIGLTAYFLVGPIHGLW